MTDIASVIYEIETNLSHFAFCILDTNGATIWGQQEWTLEGGHGLGSEAHILKLDESNWGTSFGVHAETAEARETVCTQRQDGAVLRGWGNTQAQTSESLRARWGDTKLFLPWNCFFNCLDMTYDLMCFFLLRIVRCVMYFKFFSFLLCTQKIAYGRKIKGICIQLEKKFNCNFENIWNKSCIFIMSPCVKEIEIICLSNGQCINIFAEVKLTVACCKHKWTYKTRNNISLFEMFGKKMLQIQ